MAFWPIPPAVLPWSSLEDSMCGKFCQLETSIYGDIFHHFPMIFPSFSIMFQNFPMIFLSFPMIVLWCSHHFPMIFPWFFPWISHGKLDTFHPFHGRLSVPSLRRDSSASRRIVPWAPQHLGEGTLGEPRWARQNMNKFHGFFKPTTRYGIYCNTQ